MRGAYATSFELSIVVSSSDNGDAGVVPPVDSPPVPLEIGDGLFEDGGIRCCLPSSHNRTANRESNSLMFRFSKGSKDRK